MAKLTFTINECKISRITTPFANYAYGKITWESEGFTFDKSFETKSGAVVDVLKDSKHLDKTFMAQGYLSKKPGAGDHAGKIFENLVITKLEVMA